MTSRRKIERLTESASRLHCAVLIRTGGVPGIMYVEGGQAEVGEWVASVRVRVSLPIYLTELFFPNVPIRVARAFISFIYEFIVFIVFVKQHFADIRVVNSDAEI